jgi:HemY protein
MRAALWLLALFALAVAITLVARLDQGYVIVVFPPWRLEMSFLLTVVLLAGGFVLVSFLLHLSRTALRLPEDLRAWRRHRHQAAADHALLDAFRAHFAGDEKKLRKALKKARDCSAQDLLEKLQPTPAIEDKGKEADSTPAQTGV